MRASNLAVSPSREICPDAGLTHQSPIRSVVEVGRTMGDRGGWPLPLNREATVADYTPLRTSADLLSSEAISTPSHHCRCSPPRCTLNSEVFRVFQAKAQDFQGSPAYRAACVGFRSGAGRHRLTTAECIGKSE